MSNSSGIIGFLRRISMDVSPLRVRDFRLLMISGVITMFGNFTTYVAIPYQIKELTDSYVMVGLIGAIEIVPMVICGIFGGALADAIDRRRIIVWCEIGMTLLSVVLVLNSMSDSPSVWPLYIVAAGMSALDGLQRPSLNALIPRLVERDKISAANALQGFRWQIGSIAGPAVGGVLVTQVGLSAAYGIDLASFVISALLLLALRPAPAPEGAERPSLRAIGQGFKYAFSRQELIGTYVVDIAAMFFAMPMTLYPFVADALHADWALGLLYAATSVGALLVSLTSGWTGRVHRHGLAVLLAAAVWGLAIAGFGVASNVAVALLFLIVAGGADMVSGIFRQTIWNQTIPDNLRGRLAGIELLSFSIGPTLGQMRAGGMAAWIGLRGAIAAGGLMCFGSAALLAPALPRFVRYDDRTSPHSRQADPSEEAGAPREAATESGATS